ncbi:MAG: GNAT family N-acetyltransferase [Candidatus Atabeyarchaeum deiterrae]
MVAFKVASNEDIRALGRKLLHLLEDHESQVYQENIVKFGIPDDYVKKVFAEDTLIEAAKSGKAVFYLVLRKREIVGFAQTLQHDPTTAELDRIIIFPEQTRKGIGTLLLRHAAEDQKRRGIETMVVNAGKEESHARRFYEKNGFQKEKETTIQTPWGGKIDLVTYKLDIR